MSENPSANPVVGIVMGSANDAPTMRQCALVLDQLGIGYEMKVCSAHRTPKRAHDYVTTAAERGLKIIIAAAGMSAHLAGVMAAGTHLPVLGVPMDGKLMGGLDALLSTCNMPKGIPVGTMSMGSHGAVNAALFAAAILALTDKELEQRLLAYRQAQTDAVPEDPPTG
jgi:5-(carboxyamino)imidazole ribonucleotide mutase